MKITENRIINADVSEVLTENLDWDFFSGKTFFVAGANGMLPSYIIYTLIALNETILDKCPCKVVALVRNKEKAMKKFNLFLERNDFELIVGDVTTSFDYEEDIDIIIHAASQASPKFFGTDPVGTLKANTVGTMNLLELARKKSVKKFLFISSGEIYGTLDSSQGNINENYTGNVDITNIRSCYAESKRMGETMCVSYSHQYGIPVNIIRVANSYAPGCDLNDGRVFADFARNILANENIRINSDGAAKRCFLYVTDMIRGLFYVLLKGENRSAYNISSMKEISIGELAEILCSLYPEKHLHVEFFETKDDNSYMRSKSQRRLYDNSKLRQLGWTEKVALEDGFKRFIDSYI